MAYAQPFGQPGGYLVLSCEGPFGAASTGQALCQWPMQYGGRVIKLTAQLVSLMGGSCTTAPTIELTDNASVIAPTQALSNTAQALNTVTTVTYNNPPATFAAGDLLGVEASTGGGTCASPTTYMISVQVQTP